MYNKGPWYIVRHYGSGSGFEVCAQSPTGQAELATVHEQCEYVPSLPAEANARLMAAAPELLTALEELMGAMGGEPPTEAIAIAWVQALAAIAHATGGE
jgi:hypothetical protein